MPISLSAYSFSSLKIKIPPGRHGRKQEIVHHQKLKSNISNSVKTRESNDDPDSEDIEEDNQNIETSSSSPNVDRNSSKGTSNSGFRSRSGTKNLSSSMGDSSSQSHSLHADLEHDTMQLRSKLHSHAQNLPSHCETDSLHSSLRNLDVEENPYNFDAVGESSVSMRYIIRMINSLRNMCFAVSIIRLFLPMFRIPFLISIFCPLQNLILFYFIEFKGKSIPNLQWLSEFLKELVKRA